MAWKEVTIEELAKSLGANVTEIREKQRLVGLIVKERKAKKLSQAALAKKLGISQAANRPDRVRRWHREGHLRRAFQYSGSLGIRLSSDN